MAGLPQNLPDTGAWSSAWSSWVYLMVLREGQAQWDPASDNDPSIRFDQKTLLLVKLECHVQGWAVGLSGVGVELLRHVIPDLETSL